MHAWSCGMAGWRWAPSRAHGSYRTAFGGVGISSGGLQYLIAFLSMGMSPRDRWIGPVRLPPFSVYGGGDRM